MKLIKSMLELISEIECLIGSSCYNSRTYTGWDERMGRSIRYPITYDADLMGETVEMRSNWDIEHIDFFDISRLKTVRYKFGANELYIGSAVLRVLDLLERRYGLDFNKLEREYREKKKQGES